MWINTGICKKKRLGFHGYKAENVTTTTTQSESTHMQDGEEPILEFCGKNREMIVVEDVENLKTINKIVPIAGNSNSSQGSSISGVVSHKMKRDVLQKVS